MSQTHPRPPDQGGVWEPAFPPVLVYDGEDVLAQVDRSGGLSKLEWATVTLLAGTVHDLSPHCDVDGDETAVQRIAGLAQLALDTARRMADKELAAQVEAAQVEAAQADRPGAYRLPADVEEACASMAIDALEYLSQTHQLAAFKVWYERRGGHVEELSNTMHAAIAGTEGTRPAKGG